MKTINYLLTISIIAIMFQSCATYNVAIMNEKGELIKESGIDGEIVVRNNTPVAFLKYWENEEETNKKDINGWLHTGDFAFKDDQGYFYFKGREDDIINTSGYRVGPSEVEDCILSHPKVDMVAVIGVPDKVRGNIIKAFIIPRNKNDVLTQNNDLKINIQNNVKIKSLKSTLADVKSKD